MTLMSLKLEQFVLQNHQTNPTASYNLSSASEITENTAKLEIDLSSIIRIAIISDATIATDTDNTFISIASDSAMG